MFPLSFISVLNLVFLNLHCVWFYSWSFLWIRIINKNVQEKKRKQKTNKKRKEKDKKRKRNEKKRNKKLWDIRKHQEEGLHLFNYSWLFEFVAADIHIRVSKIFLFHCSHSVHATVHYSCYCSRDYLFQAELYLSFLFIPFSSFFCI